MMRDFTNLYATERIGISIITPVIYTSWFIDKARGRHGGFFKFIFLSACAIFDNWPIVHQAISQQAFTNLELFQLIFCVIVPILITLSIFLESWPLAILSAFLVIPNALYNLYIISLTRLLVDINSVYVMMLSEVLCSLGLFFGLLGIAFKKR